MKENPLKCYVIMIAKHFPSTHPKKGKPTYFDDLIRVGQYHRYVANLMKIHTIRKNYPLWEKRIKEVQEGKAYLSLRQWEGRPYHSEQLEFLRLTATDGVGLQRCYLISRTKIDVIGAWLQPVEIVAQNDGLSLEDFKNWFKDINSNETLAIIHFTKFRY